MSVYSAGTITLVSGLTTVSGYGTVWYTSVSAGNLIMKRGAGVAYTIAGITNNTQLSLNTIYPGPTESGLVYDIIKDFTANANLPKPYGADRSDWPVIWADDLDKMDNWAVGWNQTPFTCTYISAISFSCIGDKTSLFTTGTRLKIVHGGGTTYHNVKSSTYSSATTIVIDGSSISTPISKVFHSVLIAGASGSVPLRFSGANVGFKHSNPQATIAVSGLFICANNAAAVASGLVPGDLYRTGDNPDIVCVTH